MPGRNNFSNWLMGRSEISLASVFREKRADEFTVTEDMRNYIISNVHALRLWRHKGVVSQFNPVSFDAATMDFVKVGQGSLGGKAGAWPSCRSFCTKIRRFMKNMPKLILKFRNPW